MVKDLPPKDRINYALFEMNYSRVEEDWEHVFLYLALSDGNTKLIFGKRANFYFNCLREMSDDNPLKAEQRCMCFTRAPQRVFDVFDESDSIEWNGTAKEIFQEKGWPELFDAKRFPKGRGETVVIEEKKTKISFHFRLGDRAPGQLSFSINNDTGITCAANRECALHPRVTYTTYLGIICPDRKSPLLGN